ncbi:MAG: methyltransferase domain-containing protein [Bacteroidales bacterium]|nr:methyltransferase domain-containing protein [Bacteroidales bacterium]
MKFPLKNSVPFWLGRKLRGGYQKILGLMYSGDFYYCPYCQRSFRKLLPGGYDIPVLYEKQVIGAGYRENDVCPRCFSLDRDRLLYIFLEEETTIFTSPITLFHVAPEGCLRSLLSSLPNITYVPGVKYLEGYYYKRQINLLDITSIPYDKEVFDVIICNHVLEHIQNDKLAISELYRVLKPGGWAILQVPISKNLPTTFEDNSVTSPEDRERVFGQFDHVRIYGQDYKDRLENAGFSVRKFNPTMENISMDIHKYAINPEENLYIAYK